MKVSIISVMTLVSLVAAMPALDVRSKGTGHAWGGGGHKRTVEELHNKLHADQHKNHDNIHDFTWSNNSPHKRTVQNLHQTLHDDLHSGKNYGGSDGQHHDNHMGGDDHHQPYVRRNRHVDENTHNIHDTAWHLNTPKARTVEDLHRTLHDSQHSGKNYGGDNKPDHGHKEMHMHDDHHSEDDHEDYDMMHDHDVHGHMARATKPKMRKGF